VKLETAGGRRELERRRRARRIRRRRAARTAALGALAVGVLIAAGLSLGGSAARTAGPREWASAARNYVRAGLAAAPVDSLRIDIKFKHLHRIHTKLDQAREDGMLIALAGDFVPGSIATAGKDVPIRMRLLGPEPDHLAGNLWSLEVRVGEDAHIEGMRRFALHAPDVVGGALPLIAADQLAPAGLAAPRTALVEISINGDELGLAILIELPSPELLRARGQANGPIVRFDARAYWEALRDNGRPGPFDNLQTAPIVTAVRPEDEGAAATAIGLLHGFLDGRLPASRVFDLDATARWLASAELWGDPSCVHWTRVRFALDTITARLVPIPALPEHREGPGAVERWPHGELIAALGDFGSRLLADEEVRHRFANELKLLAERLERGPEEGVLLAQLKQRQQQALLRLHRFAPFTRAVDLAAHADRLESLAAIDASRDSWFAPSLARGDLSLPGVVAAYGRSDQQGAFLDLHNLLPIPVAVSTLRHDDGRGGSATPVTLASRVTFPIQLDPTPLGERSRPVRVRYRQPNAAAVPNEIRGVARIGGDPHEYVFVARTEARPLIEHPVPTTTLDEVLARHPFVRRTPGEFALRIQSGRFEVDGSLVLPPGIGLVIEAGAELVFGARAGLVMTGPLDLLGTEGEPVVLRGSATRGAPRWEGIALLRASQPSTWSHAMILDATGLERAGWQLPAAVTIRRAQVQLDSVQIAGSRADAALAAVNAVLTAADLRIEDSSGTAMLLQGTRAELQTLRIEGTGRHGLQATDSQIEIEGGVFEGIRATALEAGDGTTITARALEISGASVAAAARNGARLSLSDSKMGLIAHVPYLAFTDRPELGGGQIRATGNVIAGPERVAIAQRGSQIIVDGVPAEPVDAAIGGLRID